MVSKKCLASQNQKKVLGRNKRVRREIFWNVEVRVCNPYFVTRPRIHCVACKRSSYTKNECNLFYQKLDAEYFFIRQFFRKTHYFLRKPWKTVFEEHTRRFFRERKSLAPKININFLHRKLKKKKKKRCCEVGPWRPHKLRLFSHCSHPFFLSLRIEFSAFYSMLSRPFFREAVILC